MRKEHTAWYVIKLQPSKRIKDETLVYNLDYKVKP